MIYKVVDLACYQGSDQKRFSEEACGQHRWQGCCSLEQSNMLSLGYPYWYSAFDVNRLPTRVVFQSLVQQNGAIVCQEQCIYRSQYPKPFLDQPVARQIGFVLLKRVILLSISCIITDFDSQNNSSSWLKGVSGCSRCWNGWSFSDEVKAHDTWLVRPNQDLMSWMFFCVRNPAMAYRNLWHGLTLLLAISNLAKVTVSCPNWNFIGWRVMPLCPHKSSQSTAWKKTAF